MCRVLRKFRLLTDNCWESGQTIQIIKYHRAEKSAYYKVWRDHFVTLLLTEKKVLFEKTNQNKKKITTDTKRRECWKIVHVKFYRTEIPNRLEKFHLILFHPILVKFSLAQNLNEKTKIIVGIFLVILLKLYMVFNNIIKCFFFFFSPFIFIRPCEKLLYMKVLTYLFKKRYQRDFKYYNKL